MRVYKIFISIIIFTILVLSGIQLIVSNALSTDGVELSLIEDKIKYYNKENAILKEKMLSATSFVLLASKASELGFALEKERIYLTDPLPVAVRP